MPGNTVEEHCIPTLHGPTMDDIDIHGFTVVVR